MRNTLVLFLSVIIFSSCQSLKFDRYPGKVLAEIPGEFQGSFLSVHDNNNASDTDTIVIERRHYSIIENGKTVKTVLDSVTVFSQYGSNYFLFMKSDTYWTGFLVYKKDRDLFIAPFISPTKNNSKKDLRVLNKYFEDVKKVKGKTQLESETYSVKMSEENLLKYIKKHKRFTIKLIHL
jgi:hypothetical protein